MYFESIKNGYNHQYLYLGSVGLLVCVCLMFFCFTNFVGGLLTFMHMNSVFSLSFEDIHCLSFLLPWIYLSICCSGRNSFFSCLQWLNNMKTMQIYIQNKKRVDPKIQESFMLERDRHTSITAFGFLIYCYFTVLLVGFFFLEIFFVSSFSSFIYIFFTFSFPFFLFPRIFVPHTPVYYSHIFLGENTTISISALFNNWRRKKQKKKHKARPFFQRDIENT